MRWYSAALTALTLAGTCAAQTPGQVPAAMYHQKKYVMGTVFEVVVYDTSEGHARAAMEKALQEVVRLDQVMSNYKADSELSVLNREGHYQARKVSPDLYRVIEESLEYSKRTDGKFDISVGPLVDRWKGVMNGKPAPTAEEEAELRKCVGYQKIELIPPDQIEFRSSCLRIDLGAIGKGYAVDRAVEILRASGIENALIDAGGSTLFGMGAPPGEAGWLVHLRDPSKKVDPQAVLHENSASTSEQTAPSMLEKEPAGHIIDPGAGTPARTRYALSVVARTATQTDGLSTSLLLLGPEKGRALVMDTPESAAIWILPDGSSETAVHGAKIQMKDSGKNCADGKAAEFEGCNAEQAKGN